MSDVHANTESGASEPRTAPEHRTTADLLRDLIGHLNELVRKELMLFQAELGEKANQAVLALGMLAASLVIAIVALNVLAAAVVAAIENAGLSPGWSAAIVGTALAAIGLIFAVVGMKSLKLARLAPRKTAESLSKDARLARERAK